MENKLPKNWVETELKNLSNFVIGGDWGKDPNENYDAETELVYCIRGSELKNWNTQKGRTASLRKIKPQSLKKRRLQEGDILIEISGGGPEQPVGRTVYIDKQSIDINSEYDKVCTNFLRLIRLNDSLEKKFVQNYLRYFYLTGEVIKYQGGSNNLRNLKYKEFETIKIPLPPKSEQERIVAKLDHLFTELDTLNQKLNQIPNLLKNCRQAILNQAVTGKLTKEWRKGKELEEWEETELKNLTTKIGSGSTPKGGQKSYKSEGIPLVRSMNIHFFKIKYDGLAFIDEKQAESLKNVELQENDVLLNITGASIGRVCLIEPKLIGGRVNQHVSIIRSKPDIINPKYLNLFLSSSKIQQYIFNENYGVTRQALTKSQTENLSISYPPKEEQTEIVHRVEQLFTELDLMEAKYKTLKQQINNLPQAILHKAFKGELVPQLATDGNAEDLLKEIQELKVKN